MAKSLTELGRRERQIIDILVRRQRATAAAVLADRGMRGVAGPDLSA